MWRRRVATIAALTLVVFVIIGYASRQPVAAPEIRWRGSSAGVSGVEAVVPDAALLPHGIARSGLAGNDSVRTHGLEERGQPLSSSHPVAEERRQPSSSSQPVALTGNALSLRCGGLLIPRATCSLWYTTRELVVKRHAVGGERRACASNCHGRGICDQQTGVCACEAGYNGSACEGFNLRECNGRTDGLWHASHCAGECDERRGYCFCPGRIDERPMSDTCQVRHMEVDAFAALVLKPDPAWIRFGPDGKQLDVGIGKGSGLSRTEEVRSRHDLDADLERRRELLAADHAKRSQVLRRAWFGEAASEWVVKISPLGVPHAYRRNGSGTAARRTAETAPTGRTAGLPHTTRTARPVHGRRLSDGHLPRQSPTQRLGRRLSQAGLPGPLPKLPSAEIPGHGAAERRTHGRKLYQKLAARNTYPATHILARTASGPTKRPAAPAWCDAAPDEAGRLAKQCACTYDGMHGPLCAHRHEPFCLNQCSGHGSCDAEGGGFCHCDLGYFGIDCSMTSTPDGRVALHSAHAARVAPRSPSVYVYELWDHTSLILQYRGYSGFCVHRTFSERNETQFNDHYAYAPARPPASVRPHTRGKPAHLQLWRGQWRSARCARQLRNRDWTMPSVAHPTSLRYTIETALHEWLLRSPHRTLDGDTADYYFVPTYLACAILPVYDWVGPGPFATGYPMRPVTAMRMAHDALQQVPACASHGLMPFFHSPSPFTRPLLP